MMCEGCKEYQERIAELESLIGDAGFALYKSHCEEIIKLKKEIKDFKSIK